MKILENYPYVLTGPLFVGLMMEYFEKKSIFAVSSNKLTDITFMTTYTITIDEKTKSGKSLIAYLRSLGIVQESDDTTLKAVKELKDGKVTRCTSFEDYLAKVQ